MPYNRPSIIDDVTTGEAANWLTWFEDIYDQAIADAVGGTTPQQGIFLPETYGAVGDGVSDDTSALQQCWDALKTSGSGTMLLGPKTYLVSSPPRTDRGGNSILALGGATSGPLDRTYGVQGIPGRSRIQTNRTDGSYSANYGPPSVVGGPTWEQLNGLPTPAERQIRHNIVWSGVDVYVPPAGGGGNSGPSYCGLDLGKYVKASVSNCKMTSTAPATLPSRLYTFGLRLPIGLTHGENHAEYVNSTGWYCGFVIHTAHLVLLNTIPKWCVLGYGIDEREGADNHAAYAGYIESEWCNYHLGGWHPVDGVEDLEAPRQFYITGSWDTEDMSPDQNGGVTLTGNSASGTNVISGVANTAAVTVGDYIVSSLFPLGATVASKTASTVTAQTGQNAFGTQTGATFQIGGEEGVNQDPIWWYTIFHVFDINNRIFGHLNWQNVLGDVAITANLPTKRGGDNLAISRISTLQGSIPPAARVYNNAALPVLSTQATTLTFNSERFDTRDLHHPTVNTSRLAVPVSGIYQISAHVQWQADSAATAGIYRQLLLMVNGVAAAMESRPPIVSATVPTRMSIATTYQLAPGDYVEVQVFQNSGSTLNVEVSGGASPEFAMTYLGNVT